MRFNAIFLELNIVRNFSRILHFTTPESDSEAEFGSIKDRNKFLNNTHFKPCLFMVVWILKVEDEKIIKILTRLNPFLYSEICLPFEEWKKLPSRQIISSARRSRSVLFFFFFNST